MKIGFFSPTINRVGGGEWVTLNMICALKAKKHETVVYSAEQINQVHIQRFFGPALHFEVVHWPSVFDPYSLENIYPNCLKSFIFSLKCDLLVDTFSNALLLWTDAVYFNGIPKALRLPKGMKGALFSPYKTLLTHTNKHVKTENKVLMACSKWSAKIIEDTTGLHVETLYPPISEFFKTKNVKNQPKNNTVTTVTRISSEKNLEIIPKIAKLVSDEITFIIIGSCKHAPELNTLSHLRETIRKLKVEKKVKLLLNISREQHRDTLKNSKVYLHPSFFEAFGISIVEAMSAGCIPIVPDYAGPREFVPKKLRYTSIKQAATMIDASIANWTPHKAKESINIADRFNQPSFNKKFLKLMKL